MEDEKNPEQLNPVTRKSAYPCDSKQNLFVLNGKTYIGERSMATDWPNSVHMLRDKQIEEICLFGSRPYYEVRLSE